MDHARREAATGEIFLEFRLDFLDDPSAGAAAIAGFLEEFPDCILLATCRRHQNHGRYNGSIEEQLAILDLAVRSGAHAIDVEIETAEICHERLAQFRGRALLVVSYHNFEATPPMETVVHRVMKVPADAYKMVTTARKPSDNLRVLSVAKALPKQHVIVLAMGELGFPTRVLSPVFGGVLHLCRAHSAGRHCGGTGQRQIFAASLSGGKARKIIENLWRDCRSDPPFHFSRGTQPRLSGAARGRGLSAVSGYAGVSAGFFLAGG